jgi:hypothetical protein
MDEQTVKSNQYTYDGLTDRQGQSIYLTDIQGQLIYLRWTNTQTRAIQKPTIDEYTDKGNRYAYDRRADRKGQSIYLHLR